VNNASLEIPAARYKRLTKQSVVGLGGIPGRQPAGWLLPRRYREHAAWHGHAGLPSAPSALRSVARWERTHHHGGSVDRGEDRAVVAHSAAARLVRRRAGSVLQ